MQLSVILFVFVLFFEISAGFMVNLPNPGTEGGDALRQMGLTLLRPAEPAIEMLDKTYKLTGTMGDGGRTFLYSLCAIILNIVLARMILRVLDRMISPSAKRSDTPVKALSRAGM